MRWSINSVSSVVAIVRIINAVTLVTSSVVENAENVLRTKLGGDNEQQQLVKDNFLVGVASLGAFYENNTQCGQELELLLKAIAKHEVWGLKGVCVFCTNEKILTNDHDHDQEQTSD